MPTYVTKSTVPSIPWKVEIHLIKKFHAFVKSENSLPRSKRLLLYPILKNLKHISQIFVLIFSSHLCPSLRSGVFTCHFPNNILNEFLIFPMHASNPANPILLDLITIMIFGRKGDEIF
jgi:hypothetical protein